MGMKNYSIQNHFSGASFRIPDMLIVKLLLITKQPLSPHTYFVTLLRLFI